LNYLRGKKTNVPIESVHYLKSDYYSFEQSEIFDLIIKTLDLLDERYKEAFILREFDGLQYQEIADITGTTLTNAKSRVKRAREKMMEIMEPYIKDEI
jgi:RNA polymerase sigma-70 factor (ECF subfamily)